MTIQVFLQRRQWHPTPALLPGQSHGWRTWWAAVYGVAKSQTQLSDFTFTFHFHASEKEMATHSSVLAWRIPGMGEPGGLTSLGSLRVRHACRDLAAAASGRPEAGLRATLSSAGGLHRPSLPLPVLMLHLLCGAHLGWGRLSPSKVTALEMLQRALLLFQLTIFFCQRLGMDSECNLGQGLVKTLPSILLKTLSSFFLISLDSAMHHCTRIKSRPHQRPPQERDGGHAAPVLFLDVRV